MVNNILPVLFILSITTTFVEMARPDFTKQVVIIDVALATFIIPIEIYKGGIGNAALWALMICFKIYRYLKFYKGQ